MNAITQIDAPAGEAPRGLVPMGASRSEYAALDRTFAEALGILEAEMPEVSWRLSQIERAFFRALVLSMPEPVPVLSLHLLRVERWANGGHVSPVWKSPHTIETHIYRLRMKLAAARLPAEIVTIEARSRSGGVGAYLLRRL